MFNFWGKVRTKSLRGKRLGFPTANIKLSKKIPEGIYISKTRVDNQWLPSLTFIGSAKTFEESDFKAESYILDFDKDIYNKWISIKLLKKIRGNKKFNSEKQLIKQMKKDEEVARDVFRNS